MTINDIVANLYTDRRVNEFINLQEPADLRGDLFHHCILEVYRLHDKYPGKIEALHKEDKMFAFFVGMVRNQNWSEKSTFFSRFKRRAENLDDHPELESLSTEVYNEDEKSNTFGANFMEYFYNKFPERGKKKKLVIIQPTLF